MQNFWYMFAAFLVIWVGVLAYVLSLANRQKQIKREIEQLKMALPEEPK